MAFIDLLGLMVGVTAASTVAQVSQTEFINVCWPAVC